MMKVELEIIPYNEVTKKSEIYQINFCYDSGEKRAMKLSEEAYKALADHFKPKGKKVKQPAPAPKLEDVKAYFKLKGYSDESACKFHEYYETTGWRGANNAPILNWKGKALAVWFVDKNKIQVEAKTSSFFSK
jgi:hypothetical protein